MRINAARIRQLRAIILNSNPQGYRASNYRTLYHGTTANNTASIQKYGLRGAKELRGTGFFGGVRRPEIFLGSRNTAKFFANWKDTPARRNLNRVLVKVRIAKKDVKGPNRILFIRNGKMQREFKTRTPTISPSLIRSINPI